MRLEFSVPIGAFSINKSHYRDRRHKTAEYKNWEIEFNGHLRQLNIPKLPVAKMYKISLVFVYPEHTFYTAAGQVSARTVDLSNCEKSVLDSLFNNYYGVDDRLIVDLVSSKRPGLQHAIEIKIQCLDSLPESGL